MKRRITWDKQALHYFRDAIRYIRKDSPQNAEQVKKDILDMISQLPERPEIHSPDKYKTNNNGNYRAFELYRFRVSYFVKDEEIIVARIRSTHQSPLNY